ncbi:NAD(P)-binding domain-containing protein [Nocardioides sp. NPDC101246]|uniref:NAD(P)-binding domain-containing protein n=1 Tax=Nocardioides sp. NPDC101246 TaxID=3364336 RepID=UPI0038276BAB
MSHSTSSDSPLQGASVAILGLGEVGRIYGTALAEAGHRVTGFDPYLSEAPGGVEVADTLEEAVAGAQIVVVLTAASASRSVAETAAAALAPGAVYADFTSSGPLEKRALATVFEGREDVRLVDVAILGPVIQMGTATPLMAAGPAGDAVAALMRPLGTPVEVVHGDLGDAMAHKLLRSVFMKGLASVVVEAVGAGRGAGMEEWVRGQIAGVLAGDGQAVIDRFLTGTSKHAARRAAEMRSTGAYLAALGVPAEMTDASMTAMERMAADGSRS